LYSSLSQNYRVIRASAWESFLSDTPSGVEVQKFSTPTPSGSNVLNANSWYEVLIRTL